MPEFRVRLRDGSVETLDQSGNAFIAAQTHHHQYSDPFLQMLAERSETWVFTTTSGGCIPKNMIVLVWEEP